MVKIGNKIRQARKHSRITQEDLAQAIGVSDKSISAYESDRINPPLNVLEKIAEITHQPLSYFVEASTEVTIISKLQDVERELQEIKKILKQTAN